MLGIFDSGLGGLTIVKEVIKALPAYQLLYFGDTARTPYGTKGRKTIIKYALEDADFLIKQGARIIVVACNSASAVALDDLRTKYQLPIFEVITPAVQQAVKATKNKRIGIIGTRATANSQIYAQLIRQIDPAIKVFSQACPLLVPLVEEGWLNKSETKTIIKKYLAELKRQSIDTLILGCTHYPLLKGLIQPRIGQRVELVDPAEQVAAELKQYLTAHPELADSLAKNQASRFFVSDLTPHFQDVAQKWLGRVVKLELINSE